jgi:hypothetical protein
MIKHPERISTLFKSPSQLRIALDILEREFRESPTDGGDEAGGDGGRRIDAEGLAAWCLERLSGEQIRALQKALRLAGNHQRVYKRTVMLSPRAHLLVKTLSEVEGLRISDVIELHLDGVLREQFGMAVTTTVDVQSGQVAHDLVTLDESAKPGTGVLEIPQQPE